MSATCAPPRPLMHRRRLPIGIQTFAKIREADHYYVDKTGFIPTVDRRGWPVFPLAPAPLRQVAAHRHHR
ncbi:AAA family ATPase [Thiocystis violacea]|uniref:AAA family ATPase n=1 Tax=Thiocystis violacea TaxID=13725 RepID=UPI003F87BA83